MCNVRTSLTLLLFIISEVTSTGNFKLELRDFTNIHGLLADKSCCAGTKIDGTCSQQCKTYFKICLKQYQTSITADDCSFGEFVTEVLGDNSLTFPRHRSAFTNPLIFTVGYSWPGDFSLIISAYHETSSGSESLIANFQGSSTLVPMDGLVQQTWNTTDNEQTLRLSYQMECDPTFFGDECSKTCTPRDDDLGHYECGVQGERVCRQGWKGEFCDKAICLEGCSEEHGECSKPNECSCRIGWQGRYCNECLTYPDCEHGYCQEAWQCTCYEGWGGLYCNQDLNYCTTNSPCRNGGSCSNTGQGSYTCSCPIGFTGTNCETEIDNCMIDPCLNGGICKDIGNDYLCECPPAFAGPRCDISAARCEENPCANGGSCDPVGTSYRCRCTEGWTGVNCQQEINECMTMEQPCQNGGRCVDGLNSFSCVCPPGFSGQFCEVDRNECEGENPCKNGGQCVDGNNRYQCRCRPGFMGDLCETDIDDCLTMPCANGGSCQDRVNDFVCICAQGYQGRMCNEPINQCESVQCKNGGSCEALINGFRCHCKGDFEGDLCEYRVGQAPSTTMNKKPTTTSRATSTSLETNSAPHPGGKTGKSRQEPVESGNVSISQQQLIIIACLAGGVPMCLLFILVTILLYRRCRRRPDNDSLEAQQNALNGMNNRIHNPVGGNPDKGKAELYEYPTTEKKVINDNDTSVPVHQLPLDYKNSAAAQPVTTKVHKDMIKDINRVHDRQMLGKSNNSVAPTTARPISVTDQQYSISQPYGFTASSSTTHRSGPHSTNNSNNADHNGIATVCDTVLHTACRPDVLHGTATQQRSDTSNSHNSQTTLVQPPSKFRHSHHEHSDYEIV